MARKVRMPEDDLDDDPGGEDVQIAISLDNAAFEDDYEGEIAHILDQVEELLLKRRSGILRDSNGNRVGVVEI